MTTTPIAAIIDHLPAARDEAICKTLASAKWQTRIAEAYNWLLQQDEIESYGELVLMPSDTTDEVYTVNGHCNCPAGHTGQMCKHRVRARLFKLALEKSLVVQPVVTYQTPMQAIENRIEWAEREGYAPTVEQLLVEKARLIKAEAEAAKAALMECFA